MGNSPRDIFMRKIDTEPKLSLVVLRATAMDSDDIRLWRNDKQTKLMFAKQNSVTWEEHKAWYENYLKDPNRYMYIGYLDKNTKIGMCRFDLDPRVNIAEVSININPIHRLKSLSSQLLLAAMNEFFSEKKVDLVAKIKKENVGSMKCFVKSGFVLVCERNEYNYYKFPSR